MDMRITSVYGAYSAQPSRGSSSVQRGAERVRTAGDSVSISSQASDYQAAMRAVAGAPDVRTEMVDRIQNQISEGSYSVSAYDVASKIFHGLG